MKRISKIGVMQSAKVLGVLYFIGSFVVCIPMAFFSMIYLGQSGSGKGSFIMLFMPIVYGILGFVFSAAAFGLYNYLARKMGGIEITTEEIPDAMRVS